jgi:hypothetical protein
MSIKKLTKRIWYGSDTTVDSEGKTVAAAPPIATNDGSEDWDLNGLVRGELYLNDNKDDPALFCLGSDNLPKRIGGGTASGGGGIVNVDVDVKEGRGIDVKKDLIGETVIFTVSHEDTSSAVSTSNFDDLFVQNIGVDDFGHVTSVESARLATYLDERYLRKDIDDTAHGNILFDKKIGSSIFIDGWEGKGWEIQSTGAAILDSLRVRSDIYVGGNTGSPTFASGFTGWGWQIDTPTATGEMDNLFIRKTFTAYEIVYSQIYGLGGSQIVSDINKIARVEVMSDRYRCYMDDMDGLMLMNLRKGDGVRIQTRTGTTSIKYLFGRCIGVDSDYFDIAIPLIEGAGQPEAGDFALRWGNNEDTDRQGLIYLTTADSGAPFIDVYDGITDASTEGKLKARIGHLTGIRTQRGDQLSGYGAYLNGIYVENSTFILQNGDTIEQTFIAMNGKFESLIDSIRNDISAEGGNILVNSSFSQNTNYWTAANNVHFINVGGEYLWLDGSFYVEKNQVADIYNDNGQNVLRIRNTYILQQNAIMNIPDHTEEEEKTYSFSLFYKVLRSGSCGFGIPGTELYHEEQLPESDSYQKLSKVGEWDGKGDFELRFTGEILIYGVGLFSDEIADAIVKLQTQIDQTDEYIKLLATKDYVDSETEEIYVHYDSQLQITAEQMSGISTKVDNINNTIESAGWITQADGVALFAKKEMEGGKAIVNAINVGTDGILIQANRIDLVGAVTFSMLNSSLQTTINGIQSDASSSLSKANEALSDASDAWSKAVSASNTANTAYSNATKAINDAATAISDAASAVSKAGSVEDALNSLPEWSKEASIIDALTSATVIVNGYIKTSMIDVNNLYATSLAAVRGTIGGFIIESNRLSSNMDNGGTFSVNPTGNITFEEAWNKYIKVGTNAKTSMVAGYPFINIANNKGETRFTGIAMDSNAAVYSALYAAFNWSDSVARREIDIGFAHFPGDNDWYKRVSILFSNLPRANQISPGDPKTLKWDASTGIVYAE